MVAVQITALAVVLSASGETALLDFHATWCAPCRAMEGTIGDLQRAGYPVRKINIDHQRRTAEQYRVQSVPCFVLVVDGKEVGRLTGAARRDELEALFARGGVRPAAARGEITRAQSPDPPPGAATFSADAAAGNSPSGVERTRSTVTQQDLIAASVRLKIGDPQGFSHGSGTLIDARDGEALVLTCGHIFRDSQGKGQITVDLLGPKAPQKLPGRLVSYDLDRDVALLSIKPGVPVRALSLAPRGYGIAKGDRVVSVGCNHGGAATAEASTITAINKFRAEPNLSVAGLPVQGRSGGGLFTADGQVIGVCNAADPTDNEGLYAALEAIQDELDEAGLMAIYQNPRPGVVSLAQTPGPAVSNAADRGAQLIPASMGARGAMAAQQRVETADGAEVICIIRPLSSPNAKTEVIRLDRASSDFLRQLAADRQAQEARHLTSLKVRDKSRPAPGKPR